MHTVSHSTVSSTTDYRDSLSLISLESLMAAAAVGRWPRGGERRADAVCDPPRERLVNDANERPYTTRTTAKVKSARRPTMLKILIPHVRTRPSMERRGGRDSGKSVNGAMFGGWFPGTFEIWPKPSTAPEPGGFALPPTLFVQAVAMGPGILGG